MLPVNRWLRFAIISRSKRLNLVFLFWEVRQPKPMFCTVGTFRIDAEVTCSLCNLTFCVSLMGSWCCVFLHCIFKLQMKWHKVFSSGIVTSNKANAACTAIVCPSAHEPMESGPFVPTKGQKKLSLATFRLCCVPPLCWPSSTCFLPQKFSSFSSTFSEKATLVLSTCPTAAHLPTTPRPRAMTMSKHLAAFWLQEEKQIRNDRARR